MSGFPLYDQTSVALHTALNAGDLFSSQPITSDRGDESSSSSSSGTGDGGLAAMYTTRSLNSSITLPGALTNCKSRQ